MTRQRAAVVAFLAALYAVRAIVGWWTPLQGDDWNHFIWAGQHQGDSGGRWLALFLGNHFAFSDAVGYLLARCDIFHALVSPLAMIALVVGVFTLAMRRLPRATWDDLLGLALVNCLIWIAQPTAGIALFQRANVAMYIYGGAAAVWFLVPLRCGWRVPTPAVPLLVLAGYAAGTSTRAIALATLVGALLMILASARPRARWMWIAFTGLAIGTLAGYALPPWLELARVFRRGLDPNLVLLKVPVVETGQVVSLLGALLLANAALGAFGRTRAPADGRPDPGDTLRWSIAWFLTTIWCLFGPRYKEATTLPATYMIVVAALPSFLWLARSRPLRIALVVIVILAHAIVWTAMLTRYHRFGAEGAARIAAIESAPKGTVAKIRPYSDIAETFWFPGEDLVFARQRQLLAIESFGLLDIDIDPMPRRLEPNPGVKVRLETDGLTPEQLVAARVPDIWATETSAARKQFDTLVRRLRKQFGKQFSARLVVENLTLPPRSDRPLLAAWADSKMTVIPRVARSTLDANSKYTIRIYGRDARRFDEAWILDGEHVTQAPYRVGAPQVQSLTSRLNAVIVCNKDRCLLAEAFVPRF